MYVACFFCLTLPLRKNLLGSKRKAINIYFGCIVVEIDVKAVVVVSLVVENERQLR